MATVNESQLRYLEYLHRETNKQHHKYDEELYQYKLIKEGDLKSLEERKKLWRPEKNGKVSDDELKNWKYIFVASITLACRAAIEGGMEEMRSYNASDLYIQRVDKCRTIEEIDALHEDMFRFYTNETAAARIERIHDRNVAAAEEYIDLHLHEKLTRNDIAEYVGLSAGHLAALFRKETGITLAEYITLRRIEAAKNMLQYSSFPYGEIASILDFCSQSRFIQVFKKHVGCTPKEFRDRVK